ncbi:hypothetical protein BT69DRAFT_1327834 [Atractiella rhizophila]|nr:hypothetical protein BT69DRAFT_1327834 [Atractiella rhizophila]
MSDIDMIDPSNDSAGDALLEMMTNPPITNGSAISDHAAALIRAAITKLQLQAERGHAAHRTSQQLIKDLNGEKTPKSMGMEIWNKQLEDMKKVTVTKPVQTIAQWKDLQAKRCFGYCAAKGSIAIELATKLNKFYTSLAEAHPEQKDTIDRERKLASESWEALRKDAIIPGKAAADEFEQQKCLGHESRKLDTLNCP